MRNGRTPEENRAIEEWLSENEPYKAHPGESGLYDEFGVPRKPSTEINETMIKNIRICREMLRDGFNNKAIARRLGISRESVKHLRVRWLMG